MEILPRFRPISSNSIKGQKCCVTYMYVVPKFNVWGILDSWGLPNQLVVSVPTIYLLIHSQLSLLTCDAAFQTRASGECPKLYWALSDLSVSYCTRWWVSFLSFRGLTLQHTWYIGFPMSLFSLDPRPPAQTDGVYDVCNWLQRYLRKRK